MSIIQKDKYCCEKMQYEIDDFSSRKIIEYDPPFRAYNFILRNSPDGTHMSLYYCPWCGTKLPQPLGDEWDEVLAKEFGITEYYGLVE